MTKLGRILADFRRMFVAMLLLLTMLVLMLGFCITTFIYLLATHG